MKKYIIFGFFLSLVSFPLFSKVATFAGGCFWCMEPPFENIVGVEKVISGYSGGVIKNPSYEQVASGKTQHREAVQVHYDPELVSYKRLLEIFWQNVNPMDNKGQFVDRGRQYSPAIFYSSSEEKRLSEKSFSLLKKRKGFSKTNTPIIKFQNFFPAEEYHQDFYKKSLITKAKYKYYRSASGRDDFLNKFWQQGERLNWSNQYSTSEMAKNKKKLTKLQFEVTQNNATEKPFKNDFWENNKVGLYVDVVSGEPLFSSRDKYKSGTGWPSFKKPFDPYYIIEVEDKNLLGQRIEVRSRFGDSHLGHVFKDGPSPKGLRYCINSAAMRFVPLQDFKKYGLEDYQVYFK